LPKDFNNQCLFVAKKKKRLKPGFFVVFVCVVVFAAKKHLLLDFFHGFIAVALMISRINEFKRFQSLNK
jgi:hypothetical protein